MSSEHREFNRQFELDSEYYTKNIDFINWYRYYFIIKEVIDSSWQNILEVGVGNGIVKKCLKPLVKGYTTMDINPKLAPDIVADVLHPQEELIDKFDCAIIADVVEHMPFDCLEKALANLRLYLCEGGEVIITIPHRRSNFLFMSPTYVPRVFTVPTGFLSFGAFYRRFIKRRIWIDPHHCWEIGDGTIKRKDVEAVFTRVGFRISKFQKLVYVDWWKLEKWA